MATLSHVDDDGLEILVLVARQAQLVVESESIQLQPAHAALARVLLAPAKRGHQLLHGGPLALAPVSSAKLAATAAATALSADSRATAAAAAASPLAAAARHLAIAASAASKTDCNGPAASSLPPTVSPSLASLLPSSLSSSYAPKPSGALRRLSAVRLGVRVAHGQHVVVEAACVARTAGCIAACVASRAANHTGSRAASRASRAASRAAGCVAHLHIVSSGSRPRIHGRERVGAELLCCGADAQVPVYSRLADKRHAAARGKKRAGQWHRGGDSKSEKERCASV